MTYLHRLSRPEQTKPSVVQGFPLYLAACGRWVKEHLLEAESGPHYRADCPKCLTKEAP